MIDERFVFLAFAINIFGSISYFINTLKGKTKPNKVTWFLWTLAPFIAFAAQIYEGVGLSALMTFGVGFVPLLIFLASFVNKEAHWKITRLDIACGLLSLVGIFFWFVTQEGIHAIFFSVLADALAAIPTIIKSYNAPETETAQAYFFSALNGIITTLTLTTWTFEYYAFPVYMIIGNGIIFLLVQFRIGKYVRRR
jgi:hypothetical protein